MKEIMNTCTFLAKQGEKLLLNGIDKHLFLTTFKRNVMPRRACLYVPGNDGKKIKKASGLDVDSIILDCEDGVAVNKKKEARHTIKHYLNNCTFNAREVIVRVNSLGSGLIEEDLSIVLSSEKLPSSLMLPKVESASDLYPFVEMLEKIIEKGSHTFDLIIFIESALGMLNLQDICNTGNLLKSPESVFSLKGLVFGSDDFCADIGATRTADGRELMYARQKLVMTAKAFGLQAIDMVHIDFKDLEGLKRFSTEGAQMGFTGKQCIHPAQVPIVQECFTPSRDKVQWATELIEAFNNHQCSGQGAFTFRGHMIDMPLLLQAKNILSIAENIQNAKS